MIIYRTTDRIPVSIGKLRFWIAPLSVDQKGKLLSLSKKIAGGDVEYALESSKLTLRFSVKAFAGEEQLKLADGSPYALEFEPDGSILTEECADELLQLDGSDSLVDLCKRWALNKIEPIDEIRRRHVEQWTELKASGKVTQEQFDRAISRFLLDGVTVDFGEIRTKKKATAGKSE